jgi:hypothetical protein
MQAPEQYVDPTLVDSDPKLCVIVRTYLPQAKSGKLFSLLFSFLAKHPPNVHITLVNTDSRLPEESVRTFSAVRDDINSLFGRRYVDISPITSDKVLAKHPNANSGDLQYLTADEVMELLLNSADPDQALSWSGDTNYAAPPAKKSFCKYFLVTNGDNLYAARFLPAVTLRMRENADLIGTDFISRYYFPPDDRFTPTCMVCRNGKLQQVYADFKVGRIDLGTIVVSAAMLQRTGTRFCLDRFRTGSLQHCEHAADGIFTSRVRAAGGGKAVIVPEVLMFHQ